MEIFEHVSVCLKGVTSVGVVGVGCLVSSRTVRQEYLHSAESQVYSSLYIMIVPELNGIIVDRGFHICAMVC